MWNNSIYIPTIYKSINIKDLWDYLEKNFGKISRIDFVNLNENCRRAFVHFSEWYMDKGMGKIARNKIETDGICNFIMPIPNKPRKWFQGKMLINKKPLSDTPHRKVTYIEKSMNLRLHDLETTVNDLKYKVSTLEDKLDGDYEVNDKGPMHISELQTDDDIVEAISQGNIIIKNKSKLISQGNYNTKIQSMFYSNNHFDVDDYFGWN